MIGKQISHYKILEKLGEGGMGVIYKAEDFKLERIVAIKILLPQLTQDEGEKKRFIREAITASALDHPNICTIHEIDETEEGHTFIVMACYQGETLKDKIQRGSFKMEEVLDTAFQIIRGLEKAHHKGIVHRDIKPANIFVTEDKIVKIVDFGLAKLAGQTQLTKAGSTMGTVAYMSPEQARGEEVDHRTDIWSLGIILYEMISGQLPFNSDYEQATIYGILNENPKPLQHQRPDTPTELEGIVSKALAKNPAERYQNCEQLLRDLHSFQRLIIQEKSSRSPIEATLTETNKNDDKSLPSYLTGQMKMISRHPKFWMTLAAVVVLAAIGFYIFISTPPSIKLYNKKIAVLPFNNLSENPDHEYFSDGITEDIMTQLAKIGDLKVISRTTMMLYKGSNKTLPEISKELNAGVILEGSVRHDVDQFRITAKLIDANTDEHLWAETYDEEIKQVFAIQNEIAQKIAMALQARLSPSEKDRLKKPTTSKPEVYNLFLQGKYLINRGSREDIAKAMDKYLQALSIDSNDAKVWAELATVYIRQADKGSMNTEEGYLKARQAANKALSIDDKLAHAYVMRGMIKRTYDWDWIGADLDFQKALTLEPGNASIIGNVASLTATLGRFDEAIPMIRKAKDLDPLALAGYTNLGLYLMYTNGLEEAATVFQEAIELNPQYPASHLFLGEVYLLQGNIKMAISEMQKETDEGWRMYGLSLAYYGAGRKEDADSLLNELIAKYQNDSAFQIAEVYAFRGDKDQAFEWLEKAYTLRDGGLSIMNGDPFLKNLKDDPRYVAFMEKMKIPITL